MYQKVRLRLTLLCTGITASIMIIMSLCYLHGMAFQNGITGKLYLFCTG